MVPSSWKPPPRAQEPPSIGCFRDQRHREPWQIKDFWDRFLLCPFHEYSLRVWMRILRILSSNGSLQGVFESILRMDSFEGLGVSGNQQFLLEALAA